MNAPNDPPDLGSLKARNLAFFGKFAPQVAETLAAYSPQSELVACDGGEWDVILGEESAFDGRARAFAEDQLKTYFETPDRLTLDKPGPRQFDVYAERFFETLSDAAPATDSHQTDDGYFLVVFGVGLGFHLQQLVDRSNCQYLLIADQDLEFLHHSLSTFDWAGLIGGMEARGGRINFVIDTRPVELARSVFSNIFLNNPCALDGSWIYLHREAPEMGEAVVQLKADLGAMYGNLGHFYDELLMLKNTYLNLHRGTSAVFRRPAEAPAVSAIVVASGPSLDKDIGVLKALKDRAVIISSGSAIRPLLRAGIQPDFHVEMENIDVLPLISQVAQDHDLSAITLIAAATVDPGVLDYFGRVVFFLRPELCPFPLFDGGVEMCLPNPDPTVVNTSLSFAQATGFPEIYLFGADLGVADPDHHHSRESYHYTDDPIVVPEDLVFDIPVAGNFGDGRLTSRGLYTAGVSITSAVGTETRGIKFFNCSDGILIDGVEPKAPDTVDLPEIPGGREAAAAGLFAAFPVLEKERFDAAWRGDELTAAAAATAEALMQAFGEDCDLSDKAYMTRLMAALKPGVIGLGTEGAGPEGSGLMLYRGTVYMMLIGMDFLLNRMTAADIETFAPKAREEARELVRYMAKTAQRVLNDPLSEELPEEDSPLNR